MGKNTYFEPDSDYIESAYGAASDFADTLMTRVLGEDVISTSNQAECFDWPPDEPEDVDWYMETFPYPTKGDTTMTAYTPPSEPILSDITVDAISGIPGFDVAPLSLNLPTQPDMIAVPDFGTPDPIDTPDIPVKPSYDMPAVPSFFTVEIPAAPIITDWSFEGTMPSDNLVDPVNTFSFSEVLYSSELSTQVKDKLLSDVINGGTGLGETIENAIWDRQEERDLQALQEAKDRVSDEWATRGFSLPDGVLTTQLQELEKQYNDARLTASRDISIKQAELAQTNTHFAIEKSISYEGQLMNYTSQMCQRALDAAKAQIDANIAIFNAQVARYNAQLEGYKTQAQIYEIRIRGNLARVEVFKAQIESAKLTGEINMQMVELYRAQIGGIEAMIKCYVAEMEGAKVKTDVERLKLEAFKSQIDVQTAILNANLMEFQAYEAAIKGELAKAEIYGKQVEAYRQRVEAVKVEADIAVETAKVESEVQKNTVASYASQVEAYKAKVEAEKSRVQAIIDTYRGEVEAYKAGSEAEAAKIKAIVDAYQAQVQKYGADIQYVSARGNACTELKKAEIQATAQMSTAATQAAAQVAAAQISTEHWSHNETAPTESTHKNHSWDETKGDDSGMSKSEQHTYDEKKHYYESSNDNLNRNWNYTG